MGYLQGYQLHLIIVGRKILLQATVDSANTSYILASGALDARATATNVNGCVGAIVAAPWRSYEWCLTWMFGVGIDEVVAGSQLHAAKIIAPHVKILQDGRVFEGAGWQGAQLVFVQTKFSVGYGVLVCGIRQYARGCK